MKEKYNPAKLAAYFISFVFHPVFIPFYTVVLYFYVTPRYFIPQNIRFLEVYLLIVSIFIPLLFFGVMLYAKSFTDIQLQLPKERLFFSLIIALVYFIIFKKMIHYHQYLELYPFFLGVFLAILSLSIYNYFDQKPSIHAMAMAGSIAFLSIWSYYSQINILSYLSILILLTAIVIAARLYLQAHDLKDIIRGIFIGIFMQLLSFYLIFLFF